MNHKRKIDYDIFFAFGLRKMLKKFNHYFQRRKYNYYLEQTKLVDRWLTFKRFTIDTHYSGTSGKAPRGRGRAFIWAIFENPNKSPTHTPDLILYAQNTNH